MGKKPKQVRLNEHLKIRLEVDENEFFNHVLGSTSCLQKLGDQLPAVPIV